MAIIDWPTSRPFQGAQLQLDLAVQRSGFTGFYSGQRQHVSHAADRRTAMLTLPPCKGADAPARAAFLHGWLSRGDWVRLGMQHQAVPRGTLRGSPTVAVSAAAGYRLILLQCQPFETLLAGDWIGVDGNLLQAGFAGGAADVSGSMGLPLVTPLQRPITAGAAVTWAAPTGLWQLDAEALQIDMQPGGIQGALVLPLREVFA